MHTYIHNTYIHNTNTHTHTYTYIHTYIHSITYIHTYLHTHTYTHTYIHTYIHIYTYIYIIPGGLPFEIKQSSSSTADKSLFEMITCTSSEKSLSDCNIQEGDCMKYCSTIMGLKCFGELYIIIYIVSTKITND